MTDAELAQLLERLARLENEMKQLTEMVKQLAAPGGEPQTVREQGEAYTTEGKLIKQTNHPHIVMILGVQGGEPIVRGVTRTVRGIVELSQRGLTPQQILEGWEGRLTLAQVYDALSYYYDHQAELDQLIAEHKAALEAGKQWAQEQALTSAQPRPTNLPLPLHPPNNPAA